MFNKIIDVTYYDPGRRVDVIEKTIFMKPKEYSYRKGSLDLFWRNASTGEEVTIWKQIEIKAAISKKQFEEEDART